MSVPQNRLGRGTAWNLVGTAFNRGSTFIVNVLVARLLGRELFGQYSLVLSTVMSASLMAQLAAGSTATRYIAQYRSVDKDKTGRIIALLTIGSVLTGGIAGGTLALSSNWLATSVLHTPQIQLLLILGAIALPFTTFNGFLTGALAGFEGFTSLAHSGIISGIIYVVLGALGAWGWGLPGTVVGIAASAAAQTIVLWTYSRIERNKHAVPLRYSEALQELHIAQRYALPAALGSYVSMPATWLASVLLVRQGGGLSQLALFNTALSIRIMVMVIPNNINGVATSILNDLLGQNRADEYQKTFWHNVTVCFGVVATAAIGALVLGRYLLLIYGSSFLAGRSILLILMVSALFETLSLTFFQVIQREERMWFSTLLVTAPLYVTLIITTYLLVPSQGGRGLAWAYTFGWGVALVSTLLFVARTGIRPRTYSHNPPLATSTSA